MKRGGKLNFNGFPSEVLLCLYMVTNIESKNGKNFDWTGTRSRDPPSFRAAALPCEHFRVNFFSRARHLHVPIFLPQTVYIVCLHYSSLISKVTESEVLVSIPG